MMGRGRGPASASSIAYIRPDGNVKKSAKLVVRVVVVDAAGNSSMQTKKVTLKH